MIHIEATTWLSSHKGTSALLSCSRVAQSGYAIKYLVALYSRCHMITRLSQSPTQLHLNDAREQEWFLIAIDSRYAKVQGARKWKFDLEVL